MKLDKQIATALTTTPQIGTDIKIGTNDVSESIAEAISKVAPDTLTAMAMNRQTYFEILSTKLRNASVRNADGSITLPGFMDIPIILSDNIAPNDEKGGRILFVSNKVPAAIKVNSDLKIHSYENGEKNATIFQFDFFYYVKSNIRQTKDNENQGVVSIDVKW